MYHILKTRNAKTFYFILKAQNGQIILTSEVYESKNATNNGILSVRENAINISRYERKTASNGKFFFNLKAANGEIIGSSQMYSSEAGMENGINSVRNNAPTAKVKDLS